MNNLDVVRNLQSVQSLPIDIIDLIVVFGNVSRCEGKLTWCYKIPLREVNNVNYFNGEFFIYSDDRIMVYGMHQSKVFTLKRSFRVGIHLKEFIIVKTHIVVAFSDTNMIHVFDVDDREANGDHIAIREALSNRRSYIFPAGRRQSKYKWPSFRKPIYGIVPYDDYGVLVILQGDSFAQVFGLDGTYKYSIGNTVTRNSSFYRLLTKLPNHHVLINENTEFKLYADGRLVHTFSNTYWDEENKHLFFTLKFAVSPLDEVCVLLPRKTTPMTFDLLFLRISNPNRIQQTGLTVSRFIRIGIDAKDLLFRPDGTLCVFTRKNELLCYV